MLAPTLLLVSDPHGRRLLPALRRALRDDAGRAAAKHGERRSTSCTRKASSGGTSGSASAVAFLLFALHLRVTGCSCAWRGAGHEPHERRASRRAHRCVNGLLFGAGGRHALPAALDGLGVAHAARRGEHVSAAAAARARRRSTTTASCSRTPAWAAIWPTACCSRCAATLLSLLFNVTAGYAFAKLRFAGRDRMFRRCSARW